ncbi:MAG: tetratricopeptide repeat protein [Candidatus Syntrophosphaera sp.]|nr:tetratricopeptide repeat protein [Candidatus Syntrophosphaera sp.]
MKNYIKLCLLLVLAVMSIALTHAQTSYETVSTRRAIYSDPKVWEAIDFLKNRLPQMVAEDKNQAIEEYLTHFDALNNLDERDVLYLVGHVYSVVDEPIKAIPYFEMLINDTRLGEDARRMLNLLLYYRSVYHLLSEDKTTAKRFLEDVINLFPTGRYYPTYLFLWADLISESEDHAEVAKYIENYNANRDWIQNTFKPRKAAIVDRIGNLDLNRYYQNVSLAEYYVLESSINAIQADLQTLYNELKAIPGLLTAESLERIASEEFSLLEELKKQLRSYSSPPPLDLEALASADFQDTDMIVYSQYRQGAILLQQLKGTAEYYGLVLDIMDRIFEQRYELFVKEDPSVVGKGFSDMEMKRLFDIERNINLYVHVIRSIDEVMADPDYASLNVDMRPERQEYVEKLADLQNRKDRYLAYRKHQDSVEEAVFNELLEEYYALNREKNTFDDLLPQIEDIMVAMIRQNYPREQQRLITGQLTLTGNVIASNLSDDNLNSFLANLDFIHLQLDYRNLRYREQQRQALAGTISEEEAQQLYSEISADKAILLSRHQDFVAQNPYFQALEQPSGGYLLNNAIIYYNMAELQHAVDLDNPDLALDYYRRVLQIDPDFFLRDFTLYNVAYLSSESVKDKLDIQISDYRTQYPNRDRPENLKYRAAIFQEALDAYTELADSGKYDASPLHDEAVFRLGVLNFLIGSDAAEPIVYYTEAIDRFETLVNEPDSEYNFEALYQRGWVNMNKGDEASLKTAMSDFVTLIKAVDEESIANQYLSTDFKNNSIDNIAYSLIALDGVDFRTESKGVEEIQLALADYQDLKVKTRILDKAALLKADMQAPLQAIDFLELRLQTTPLDLINPTIVDSIIKLYHTPRLQLRPGSNLAAIRTEKYQYIKDHYHNGSQWYERNIWNRDLTSQMVQDQLAVIRTAYEEIRVRRYNNLITTATQLALDEYKAHLADFASYRELFGDEYEQWLADNEKAENLLVTVMAEKNDSTVDYMRAVNRLKAFNDANPDNPDFFNDEGLAYKYTQNIFEIMTPAFADPGYAPGPGLPADRDELYEFYRDGSLRFYNVLNSPAYSSTANQQNSAQIMMDLAEIEVGRGMAAEARTRFYTILENETQLDRATLRSVYISLANIEESARNYTQAEKWYREALKFANNTKDAEEIDYQIKLQIQNNYEMAEDSGNYALVASEFLRLADEYQNDPDKYVGYRYQASEAYKKASLFQEAIDLKLEMAEAKNSMDEKYFLYYESWTIAESSLRDADQATRLKSDFIAMYPSSRYAFNLRVEAIEKLKSDPVQREPAARMYIDLHDEVRAGRIDSGEVATEDIYLWAIEIYREEKNQDKIVELLTYFTQTYPDHPQNVSFLTLLADEYLARGDEERFEYYSREIYRKDGSQSDRYLTTARQNLGRIAIEFDAAYEDKNWDLAFAKRDEFKRVEAQYISEGLSLDNSPAYAAFAFAEQEYKEYQDKLAFLRNFDRQLRAIEQGGFLRSTPNQLVMVNPNTTWQKHLFGGKPNRIPGLRAKVEAEYKKVLDLLDQPGSHYLDNGRRLKALLLIVRINEYAAEVIETQVSKYIQVSNEIYPFKDRRQFTLAQYEDLVNNQLLPYAQEYKDLYYATANGIYLDIFKSYALGGYTDQYTDQAVSVLRARNILPSFVEESAALDSNWELSLTSPQGNLRKVNSGISATTSPQGQTLSVCSIPAGNTLTLEREFTFNASPEFAFLHLVYPYDPEIYVNGSKIDPVYIPVDTLVAGKASSTRFAVRLGGDVWREGRNSFKGVFANKADEPLNLHFHASLFYDPVKLAESRSYETTSLYSNTDWMVVTQDTETGAEIRSEAIPAEFFDVPISTLEYMTNSAAQAIWATESPTELQTEVTFEVTFRADAQYRNALLDFIAPDNATLYLNGTEFASNRPMQYDTDPFVIYPTRVELPRDLVVSGQNVLRIVVQNISPYRGMLAELSINKYIKE